MARSPGTTEKIAGVRQVERPLGTRLSDQVAAQEDKFQLVTRTEEEKEKILAAAALSEHRVVAEEHMVAATAKDFYGDGSKGIHPGGYSLDLFSRLSLVVRQTYLSCIVI